MSPGKEPQHQHEALRGDRNAARRLTMEVDGQDIPVELEQLIESGSKEEHDTLKYHLLGPSLTKAGQDSVDQQKVSRLLYARSLLVYC